MAQDYPLWQVSAHLISNADFVGTARQRDNKQGANLVESHAEM